MNVIQSYRNGISKALASPWLVATLFGFNFLFAVLISFPLRSLILNNAGYAITLKESLGKFDFIFIGDFINQFGDLLNVYLNQSLFVIIVFIVFNLFLLGGILNVVIHHNGSFSGRNFWSGSGHYFWRQLRLSIYFGLLHLIVLVIFFYLFAGQGLNPLKMESDVGIIRRLEWMGPLFLLIHLMIKMVYDFAKVFVVREDENLMLNPIMKCIDWIKNYFFKSLGLFFLNLLIISTLAMLFFLLKSTLGHTSILLIFILTQIYLATRIILRIGYYGGIDLVTGQ